MSQSNQTAPIKGKQTRKQIEKDLLKARSMLKQLMPKEDWLKTPPALKMGNEASSLYDSFKNSLLESIEYCENFLSAKFT